MNSNYYNTERSYTLTTPPRFERNTNEYPYEKVAPVPLRLNDNTNAVTIRRSVKPRSLMFDKSEELFEPINISHPTAYAKLSNEYADVCFQNNVMKDKYTELVKENESVMLNAEYAANLAEEDYIRMDEYIQQLKEQIVAKDIAYNDLRRRHDILVSENDELYTYCDEIDIVLKNIDSHIGTIKQQAIEVRQLSEMHEVAPSKPTFVRRGLMNQWCDP